jgi:DNA primase
VSSSDGRVDYKSQVLAAIDIVDLISRTVALKKRGKDYVGLCPFHQEKTPSFTVSPTKQFFHCYGCKEGGNAIDFVIKRDRIEFLDALKLLGQQAGIEMPRFGVSKQAAGEKQGLLDANSAACAFFERTLADPVKGKPARDYLQSRGFDADSVRRFQIGLAPEGWDGLLKGAVGRKFSPQQLAAAGLAKARENGGGFYDTFRNRLMFPIRDETGRVIAFGGREMPGEQPNPPKYLNSPETAVFFKGRSVFGLDLARQKIVESRTVVVVEGYTDVVMAHQFGATNVVSILGTALTEQHVNVLRRFADRIVLLFDADTAGDTAVDRAVGLFLSQPVDMAIATLPGELDPDEFLLKEGAEGFERLIAAAPDALTYKWKRLVRQFGSDENDLTAQQKALEHYLELLASARGTGQMDNSRWVRWNTALAGVSKLTGIPLEELNRRLKSARPRPGQLTGVQSGAAGNRSEPINAGNPPAGPAANPVKRVLMARDRAERWILGILLLQPEQGQFQRLQRFIGVDDFADDLRRRLAETYWNYQRDEGEPVFNEFLGLLDDPALRELAIEVLDEAEALEDAKATLAEAVKHLEQERRLNEERKLIATLRRTSDETLADKDEVALLQQLQEKARQSNLRRV